MSAPLPHAVIISGLRQAGKSTLLAARYNIDRTRIYANGLSNGGGMSYRLACQLAGRIAAVGSVSGAYLFPLSACQPSRPHADVERSQRTSSSTNFITRNASAYDSPAACPTSAAQARSHCPLPGSTWLLWQRSAAILRSSVLEIST